MMKNVFLAFLMAALLLPSMALFAQSEDSMTDDDYVDVSKGDGSGEFAVGFRLGRTKDFTDETDWVTAPGIAFTGRHYKPSTGNINIGFAGGFSVGFISEMEFKAPAGASSVLGMTPGTVYKITSTDADYLLNIQVLMCGSLRGKITGPFFWVFDFGLGINADVAQWKLPIMSATYDYTLTLMDNRLGVALNAGIRWESKKGVFGELGASFGYSFVKKSTIDINRDAKDGSSGDSLWNTEGAIEGASLMSLGAPYLLIGYRF
jgi:hypothetical protein